VDKFGRIDILVNNAGIIVRKGLLETAEEEWDELMAINLKGVFLCCKEVVPVMMKQGKGKIINIAAVRRSCTSHFSLSIFVQHLSVYHILWKARKKGHKVVNTDIQDIGISFTSIVC